MLLGFTHERSGECSLGFLARSLPPLHSLSCSLAPSLPPSLPPSPTHSLTHPPTHPPTHSLIHSLTLNPTVYWACDYSSMLRLNLIHVSRMGPGCTSAQLGSSLARSPHSLAPLTHSFSNSLACSLTRSLTWALTHSLSLQQFTGHVITYPCCD